MRFNNRRVSWALTLLLAVGLAGCARGTRADVARPGASDLQGQSFGSDRRRGTATLVFVLHGDVTADGGAASAPAPASSPAPAASPAAADGAQPLSYHYGFAAAAAGAIPDSRAVALLRPGYTDGMGRQSPGSRGSDSGDSYTPDRIAAVASAIERARQRYRGARTIVVGHSGGAAMAADLAGLRPDLIDGLVLASCPCMLPEWRRHMAARGAGSAFAAPSDSFDPLMTVGGINPAARIAVLVGADDALTPPKVSRAYAEALALRGIATDYQVLPGRGHEILDDPEVLAATRRMAAALSGGTR